MIIWMAWYLHCSALTEGKRIFWVSLRVRLVERETHLLFQKDSVPLLRVRTAHDFRVIGGRT